MTTKYEFYKNEGNEVSSAVVTKEAETKIFTFNPEKKLRELNQKRGNIARLAAELAR